MQKAIEINAKKDKLEKILASMIIQTIDDKILFANNKEKLAHIKQLCEIIL